MTNTILIFGFLTTMLIVLGSTLVVMRKLTDILRVTAAQYQVYQEMLVEETTTLVRLARVNRELATERQDAILQKLKKLNQELLHRDE